MEAGYVPARPPAALRRYVLRYLGYTEHSATPVRRRQAPAGGVALIVGFHPLRLAGPAVGDVRAAAFVGGMSRTWVVTEFTGAQAGVQVDLSPLGAYTLLGRALPAGAVPALDELDDPVLAALPDRLAAAPTWQARFALVSELLAARLLDGRARRPDPEVAFAWSRLAARHGAVPVRELAAGTGWSRRHLLTRFRGQIGLGPAAAGRVLRFARASRLVATTTSGLGEVAAGCGYADQPHMVREFRALAGTTPSRFRAEWAGGFPSVHDARPATGQDRAP